jgi:hypothetical protein
MQCTLLFFYFTQVLVQQLLVVLLVFGFCEPTGTKTKYFKCVDFTKSKHSHKKLFETNPIVDIFQI